MNSLIVGATGFLGSHLVESEYLSGHRVYGLGLDDSFPEHCDGEIIQLQDFEKLSFFFKSVKPSRVFHLAALANEPGNHEQKLELYNANLIGTVNLLDALVKSGFSGNLVYAGSCSVYGQPNDKQGFVSETDPVKPVLEYGLSKTMQEQAITFYSQRYEFEAAIVRLFNMTGPGEPTKLVVSALCHRAWEAKKSRDGQIEIGATNTVRDFLDVRDVSAAFTHLMNQNFDGAVNVCSGRPVKIKEILEKVQKISGVSNYHELESLKRKWDVPAIYGDNSLLRSIGWKEKYNLDLSIQSVWDEVQNRNSLNNDKET
ncbi:NAD-dependent epimerase/dehydratase family protein [Calditrichota bacterium]